MKNKIVKVEQNTPEQIIEILRSIQKVSLYENKYLDVWFNDSYPVSISSFIPRSFPRQLFELIEQHLNAEPDENGMIEVNIPALIPNYVEDI